MPTNVPPVTIYGGEFPNPLDPATFDARAFPTTIYMGETLPADINSTATAINAVANEIEVFATNAEEDATTASDAAVLAAIDANTAQVAAAAAQAAAGLPSLASNGGKYLRVTGPENGVVWANGTEIDVQEFTASGTWTKPANAFMVYHEVLSAGTGGASGRRGAVSTLKYGGGAGGGGAMNVGWSLASKYAATETVIVGAGGTGGAAVLTDDTDGNSGALGGTSSFGSNFSTGGTVAPQGGSVSSPTNGRGGFVGGFGDNGAFGNSGGTSVYGGAAGDQNSVYGAGGGGSGGFELSNNTAFDAKPGGVSGRGDSADVGVPGGTGSGGVDGADGVDLGAGGGGGGFGLATAGGKGGDGALGGGGGGGGASRNSFPSGAGGNGGGGYVRVTTIIGSSL